MKTAKLCQNGRSQAVRLPREFRFSGDHRRVAVAGGKILGFSAQESRDVSRRFYGGAPSASAAV
jgi:antitoxin VapB